MSFSIWVLSLVGIYYSEGHFFPPFTPQVHSWRVLDLVAAAADASGSRYGRSAPPATIQGVCFIPQATAGEPGKRKQCPYFIE